jgi:hypothetical protein
MIYVGTQRTLVFYDTGASGSVICGEIAEQEGLKIHIQDTGYGWYRLVLGPSPTGEYFQISVCGMKQVTGIMGNYDLTHINREVIDYDQKNGNLLQRAKMSESVGGSNDIVQVGVGRTM